MIITIRVNITPNITLPSATSPSLYILTVNLWVTALPTTDSKLNLQLKSFLCLNLINLSPVSNPPKTGFNRAPAWNLEKLKYNFKWNQPYLSRVTNSLNSASESLTLFQQLVGSAMDGGNPWLPWASTMQKQASSL